jgi:hypothetical protein
MGLMDGAGPGLLMAPQNQQGQDGSKEAAVLCFGLH